jgi:arsenate reductase (glutaredoxin)
MPTSSQTIRLYGIANCDQVRAARAWLKANGKEAQLIDLRTQGVDAQTIDRWLARIPWDSLVNRRGMTWRSLDPLVRSKIVDQHSAIDLMLAHPLVIKRPVLEFGEKMSVGFSAALYESLFS